MKKHGILNSDISEVLSNMGHTDLIAIGDCGLPIPDGIRRIDLALSFGHPGFMEVLKVVSEDMKIERLILAEEIKDKNHEMLLEIEKLFADQQEGPEIVFISHSDLKDRTKSCKAVIRTGEITPYANIILQSGCIFA